MGVHLTGVRIEGREVADSEQLPEVDTTTVGPSFFETFEIPMVAGRDFTTADSGDAPPVAIVNEAFVRRFFADGNALGKRVARGEEGEWAQIVGVVRDYKVRTLGEDFRPRLHVPLAQDFSPFLTLVARTTDEPAAATMVEQIRAHLLTIDPDLVFMQAGTMRDNLAITTFPVRMGAQLLSVFGFLALGLAAVGLYGVVAFAVSQRTHEIGLRMALGAERADVLRLVVRQGMGVVLAGVAVGLVLATGVTWLLSSFLYGIGAVDPLTFVVTSALLLAVALLANYIPARRASNVDPLIALRR
jgi:putative ABC transport system permease protein